MLRGGHPCCSCQALPRLGTGFGLDKDQVYWLSVAFLVQNFFISRALEDRPTYRRVDWEFS
jgi:hypothetical protein